MKVVVADDEERVCALICALIDWQRLGLTLCGKAYDGISALELIKTVSPDLVITDIRMPGLDGLALIRMAKEMQPGLQFIIISGHKQFDYAQTAIKYGVAEYLLKPIKKLELEQTLTRMITGHREQLSMLHVTEQLQQQVILDRRHKRSLAFSLLLAESKTTLLATCFTHTELMRVLAIKMDLLKGFHAQRSDTILSEKIDEFISRECTSYCSDIATHLYEGSIYLLLSYTQEQEPSVLKGTDALLQFLKTQSEIFGNILFTLGLGVEVSSFDELPTSVLSCRQTVSQRLVSGPLKRYVATGCEELPVDTLVKSFVQGLQGICVQNSMSSLSSHCSILIAEIGASHLSPYVRSTYILDCFEQGSSFILEHMALEGQPNSVFVEKRQYLDNAFSMDLLEEAFRTSMEDIFSLYLQDKEENLSKPVRKAQEYLAQHFQDELLSLESISEVVNLNSSYFSSLFKRSCNKGFFEYLLDLRITEAKRLLANTEFSIGEIAQKVGYRDPKHFSRVFKKACQIKPNEYRKLYG
ncbi:MAG: response regulator [Sphaerochaeta sp.]|nr:response regulator [Sphaerochaeta sp.]